MLIDLFCVLQKCAAEALFRSAERLEKGEVSLDDIDGSVRPDGKLACLECQHSTCD
jgi:hypothetical protein